MISIFITAYNTQDYIEECLDSIENQTYFKDNDNYEILLGIDSCEKTLDAVKKIKNNYKNLKVLLMTSNVGTYITSNTLIHKAKYKYILRFDSDDIMKPYMIQEIFKNMENYNVVRYKSEILGSNEIRNFEHGSVFFTRKVFNTFGGYKAWQCGADTELLKRIEPHLNIKYLDMPLFYKRKHSNSLTQIYNDESETRKKYREIIKSNDYSKIKKLDKITGNFKQI